MRARRLAGACQARSGAVIASRNLCRRRSSAWQASQVFRCASHARVLAASSSPSMRPWEQHRLIGTGGHDNPPVPFATPSGSDLGMSTSLSIWRRGRAATSPFDRGARQQRDLLVGESSISRRTRVSRKGSGRFSITARTVSTSRRRSRVCSGVSWSGSATLVIADASRSERACSPTRTLPERLSAPTSRESSCVQWRTARAWARRRARWERRGRRAGRRPGRCPRRRPDHGPGSGPDCRPRPGAEG